jgi:hypothetical protein
MGRVTGEGTGRREAGKVELWNVVGGSRYRSESIPLGIRMTSDKKTENYSLGLLWLRCFFDFCIGDET